MHLAETSLYAHPYARLSAIQATCVLLDLQNFGAKSSRRDWPGVVNYPRLREVKARYDPDNSDRRVRDPARSRRAASSTPTGASCSTAADAADLSSGAESVRGPVLQRPLAMKMFAAETDLLRLRRFDGHRLYE